jgi:cell division protein FtsI/penicillin-binding protein 2
VFVLSQAQYQALGGNTGPLHQAPGTVFQNTSSRGAATPGLAAHLVGKVGPITAEQLQNLGASYTASSQVGQNGLEAYYEKQLAGVPGGKVQIVDAAGNAVSTLADFPATAGRPVSTSIDPVVQNAAEQALAPVTGTAGLVALRVSTGQVLAAVGLPATSAFDPALDGAFPPGSTFKILTSTALFQAGLAPSSAASCPPTVTVDGETFHNAEGDQPVSTLAQAFTESCNTAFVQLASSHLSAASFTSVAAQFGLGSPIQMGYPAFAGKVPAPADGAALAATAIGQAGVVVSPLDMAAVAADVARGSLLSPRLVSGAPADSAAPKPLDPTVVSDLRAMMASVVTSGTAAGTGLPAGTYAKTGTAEYGSGNPLPTDAWLVGWHGDVAFAMVEQDSKGNGGPVDGPIIARFLAALPASYG